MYTCSFDALPALAALRGICIRITSPASIWVPLPVRTSPTLNRVNIAGPPCDSSALSRFSKRNSWSNFTWQCCIQVRKLVPTLVSAKFLCRLAMSLGSYVMLFTFVALFNQSSSTFNNRNLLLEISSNYESKKRNTLMRDRQFSGRPSFSHFSRVLMSSG